MASMTHHGLTQALSNKGFARFGKGGHPKYVFLYQGKKTAIFTLVRNSRDALKPGWIRDLVGRLRMPDEQFLEGFVECRIREPEYLQHLLSQGKL